MKLKYEGIINHIARLLCEGKTKEAERHFRRAWKRYGDMAPVEQRVMDAHRYRLYGRPFEGYSDAAYRAEGRVLARQERSDR